MSNTEQRREALGRLENERRGREFGYTGELAAKIGGWLGWMFQPGLEGMRAPGAYQSEEPSTSLTPSRRERSTHTTTYQRVATPTNEERSEPTEWTRIFVTTEDPSDDGDCGAIEEGEYGVAGDEVLVRDLDGRSMGARQLEPGDVPATIARRVLRERYRKRQSSRLVYPEVGIA